MVSCGAVCSTLAWYLLDYSTPKIVTIRSFTIGLLNRVVQLLIIAYIAGYVIWYNKGYQSRDVAESSVTCKVKGIASTLHRNDLPPQYRQVWDTADYVIPPQENNAFFVMTNAIISPQQSQGSCSEDISLPQFKCNATHIPSLCSAGKMTVNGVSTGKCSPNNHCEISGWCPVEEDKLPGPLKKAPLLDASQFTFLVKNFIEFPKFKVKRRNVIESVQNQTYLTDCNYHPDSDPYCPIFKIQDVIDALPGSNFTTLALKGGIVGINIEWDCNLDYSADTCKPVYTFRRLDSETAKIAPGWNFRFSKQYRDNGTLTRDLFKAYGILFVFSVQGKAGKFDPVPLLLNVGSGLALLSLATVMCDVILLYVLKKKKFYQRKKYLNLIDEDFNEIIASKRPEDEDFEAIVAD